MSQRARKFVEVWIARHVDVQPYVSALGGDDERVADYAETCRRDAVAAGLCEEELDEQFPDLQAELAKAINASTATELDREIADEA